MKIHISVYLDKDLEEHKKETLILKEKVSKLKPRPTTKTEQRRGAGLRVDIHKEERKRLEEKINKRKQDATQFFTIYKSIPDANGTTYADLM